MEYVRQPATIRLLGKRFAQHVVDQIAATLEQNVNLMDAQGVIIASCDAARIGDVHLAAQQVVRTGEPVAVRPGDHMVGARPGLNLPLLAGDEVIGVVGITGDLDEIAPIAQVVRLATQLLVEHAAEQDASERREAADRSIITALIRSEEGLGSVERHLLDSDRAVRPPWSLTMFLPIEPTDRVGVLDRALSARLESAGVRWAEVRGALWVLSSVSDRVTRLTEGMCMTHRLRAVVGPPSQDVTTLRATGRGMVALASRRVVLDGLGQVEQLNNLAMEIAVAHLPADQCRLVARRVAPLTEVLRQTVVAIARHGTASAATRALHTHRNTVSQRVNRILALTGLDPRESRQLQNLTFSICAARVFPEELG